MWKKTSDFFLFRPHPATLFYLFGKKQGDGNILGVQVRKQRAWQNTTALLLAALQQPPRGLFSSSEPRPYKTAGTF